jgi:hypothetical protein
LPTCKALQIDDGLANGVLIVQRAEDSDRYEKLDLEKATAAPADILIKGVLNPLDFYPSLTGPDISHSSVAFRVPNRPSTRTLRQM